jgi:hypothetical protein
MKILTSRALTEKKGLVCANNAYASQRETKRFTATQMLGFGNFSSVDSMYNGYPCPGNVNDIINMINEGRSFLNYRGEGWSTGWWADCIPFQTSDVSSINNGQKLTFVTSIGCGVAMFDANGGNCFGEEWLKWEQQLRQEVPVLLLVLLLTLIQPIIIRLIWEFI